MPAYALRRQWSPIAAHCTGETPCISTNSELKLQHELTPLPGSNRAVIRVTSNDRSRRRIWSLRARERERFTNSMEVNDATYKLVLMLIVLPDRLVLHTFELIVALPCGLEFIGSMFLQQSPYLDK